MSTADVLEKEQRREISRLSARIKDRYDEPSALEVGFLDPNDMKLGEGWTQYHLFGTEDFDAWMREGEAGAYLPKHVYPDNHLYLILLKGEVRLSVDGESEVMDENEASWHLKPDTPLSMEALLKSQMVAIFRPPIAD